MASEFDSLMSGMGIKRMDDSKGQSAAGAKKPRKVIRRRAKGSASADASATGTPDSEARIAELERALSFIKEERSAAEAKVSTLKKRVKKLKAQLSDAEKQTQQLPPTVAQVLTDWGFSTADERQALLMVDGMLERIIGAADLSGDDALRSDLGERLVRVCTRCDVPNSKVAIAVQPDRCVICGGFDLAREARRFVDAALINGRLRIVIVGREAEQHRWVRQRVGDKRLILTLVPGSVRRSVASAQTDVDHADAVVIWDAESIEASELAVYRTAARVGEVPADSMGAFLSGAAAVIATD